MSEHEPPAKVHPTHGATDDPTLDPAADTTMFQAFVQRAEQDEVYRGKTVGAPFRLMTLVVGLAVFAGLVWLLLEI